MQFINAPSQAEHEARSARNWTAPRTYFGVTYAPDGSNWAAGVADVQPGETAITAGEYAAIFDANKTLLIAAAQADKLSVPEHVAAFLEEIQAQDGVTMAMATKAAAEAPPPTAADFDAAAARAGMDAPNDRPLGFGELVAIAHPGFETGAKVV